MASGGSNGQYKSRFIISLESALLLPLLAQIFVREELSLTKYDYLETQLIQERHIMGLFFKWTLSLHYRSFHGMNDQAFSPFLALSSSRTVTGEYILFW